MTKQSLCILHAACLDPQCISCSALPVTMTDLELIRILLIRLARSAMSCLQLRKQHAVLKCKATNRTVDATRNANATPKRGSNACVMLSLPMASLSAFSFCLLAELLLDSAGVCEPGNFSGCIKAATLSILILSSV